METLEAIARLVILLPLVIILISWPLSIPLIGSWLYRQYQTLPHRQVIHDETRRQREADRKEQSDAMEARRLANLRVEHKRVDRQLKRNRAILTRLDTGKAVINEKDFSAISFKSVEAASITNRTPQQSTEYWQQVQLMNRLRVRCPEGPMPGRVYVLTNQAMPHLVKIGYTQGSVGKRAKELSSTGVPTPFVVRYIRKTGNCRALEKHVHAYLNQYRVQKKKEFFNVSVKDAILAISECS